MDNWYARNDFVLRRKFFKIFGATFYLLTPDTGDLLGYCKQKAFKLKEDIRLFTDEQKTTELLSIQARQMLDISAAYDVTDPRTGEKVGALRRKGLKSILRDEWEILDSTDQKIGMIQEDSVGLALVRRFLFNLLPQSFTVTIKEQVVANFRQTWNFLIPKIMLDFSPDTSGQLDRRLGIAAAVLMGAIEGRQK